MNILNTTLIGLLAGVIGTGLGALIAIFLCKPTYTTISTVLGFSGGIMISIVCFDLIPESLAVGGILYGLTGIILGSIIIALLDYITPHAHFISDNDNRRYVRTGILLGIGIAMHNLPEGLAIGAGYAHSTELGLSLAIVITLQNAPEGIAMAAPMYIGGVRPLKIILACLLAGLPMGIGAYIGAEVGTISEQFLSIALGFAAGAMLYISFDELIPQSHSIGRGHTATFSGVMGIIVGLLISVLLQ